MADAFISYSRADGKEFVAQLQRKLESRGKGTWVDLEDIPPASRWEEDLREGIAGSDAFVFVLSPDSLTSRHCRRELAQAEELNKRIIPLQLRTVDEDAVPESLRTLNWIPVGGLFEQNFDDGVNQLVAALDTDLDWVRQHTHWGQRALEWEGSEEDKSFLLSGTELESAEQWLASEAAKQPAPTGLQRRHVLESRRQATRGLRRTRAAVSIALVVAVGLSILALIQRNAAIANQQTAQSRQLASEATQNLDSDPELSTLLSLEAIRIRRTDEAEAALRASLPALRLRRTLRGHRDRVGIAKFSPDGQKVVTSSNDGTARIWDAASGRQLLVLRSHGRESDIYIHDGEFSPDGRRVVTAGDDGIARIWDAESGSQLTVLRGHNSVVFDAEFSPDGKWVATSGDDDTARVWDVRSGRQITVLRGDISYAAVFSPDGEKLLTAGYSSARVWDLATRRQLMVLRGHGPLDASFSPSGAQILTANEDETARIWDAVNGRQLTVLRTRDPQGSLTPEVVETAEFSPDGQQVATASEDGQARIWEAKNGRLLAVLQGHRGSVHSVSFGPTGKRLVTSSEDGTAKIWDTDPEEQLSVMRFPDSDTVTTPAFAPSGPRAITVSDDSNTAKIWNAESGRAITVLRGHNDFTFAQLNPDGKRLAAMGVSGQVAIWDAQTGQRLRAMDGRAPRYTDISYLAVSPDANRVASVQGYTTKVWNAVSGRRIARLPGQEVVFGMALSSDGKRVVTANRGATATIWDVAGARQLRVLRGHAKGDVQRARFNADDTRVVTGSYDGTARVWDVASGQQLTVLRGHEGAVTGVAFSPNGSRVATTGDDGTARVWDVTSGRQLTVMHHNGFAFGPVFSPDGRRLITGGSDENAVRVWSCRLCGSLDSIVRIAEQRVTRELTQDERRTYGGE